MALANQPALLLADEPTGELDSVTAQEIIACLRQINTQLGLTIILVTHDLEVAKKARRALALVDGEVVVDTTDFARAAEALHQRAIAGEAEPAAPIVTGTDS